MRDQRRVNVLAKAFAVVGIALALHGTFTDRAATFRAGMLTLVASSGLWIHTTGRINTQRIIEHQDRAARLTAQERQEYAQMGWKAARLDAMTGEGRRMAGDAEVFELPHARHTPRARRDGSA
ncbi:hypothetical protein ACFWHV_32205 [Streptomyces collinus]|uniref:hypothetical protein n=1 Tax=Streptomyces collinus TaxID=42684 RepID=UPI00365C420F